MNPRRLPSASLYPAYTLPYTRTYLLAALRAVWPQPVLLQVFLCCLQQLPAHAVQLCRHQQLSQCGQQGLMLAEEFAGGQAVYALRELLDSRPVCEVVVVVVRAQGGREGGGDKMLSV